MKGQGLSITTIVVAAIALLILVVLVAVFTGQFAGFATGVRDCPSKGGVCMKSCGDLAELPGRTNCPITDADKKAEADKCCVNPATLGQ